MTVLKISAVIIISLISHLILKYANSAYSYLPSLTAVIICTLFLLKNGVTQILSFTTELNTFSENEKYFEVVLKALGISYISSITSDISREAGNEGLSKICTIAGKSEILLLSFPLINEIVAIVGDLI